MITSKTTSLVGLSKFYRSELFAGKMNRDAREANDAYYSDSAWVGTIMCCFYRFMDSRRDMMIRVFVEDSDM